MRKPTVFSNIFDGAISLYGFGIDYNNPNQNWSLKGIETSTNFRGEYPHVVEALQNLGKVQRVYAPSPDEFNSLVVNNHNFFRGGASHLATYALSLTSSRVLYRGVKADGYGPMISGDAFAMSAADCALLVVKAGDRVFAAHAGRNSLFDRQCIDNGQQSKQFPSVVDAIMSQILKEHHERAEAFVGFTISNGAHFEHPVDHPKFGASNRRLLEWIADSYFPEEELGDDFWQKGQLDMLKLIAVQLKKYGVTHITTDGVCTFSDKNEQGNPIWFSQRRTPTMRNLFVAVRNF